MRRVIILIIGMILLFSLLYVFADRQGWLDPDYVEGAIQSLHDSPRGMLVVSLLVVGLLVIDILLPVPSSVVMVLAGKFLGFWYGGLISFIGAILAAAIGFYACRLGGQRMFSRLVGHEDSGKVRGWFQRYGVYAIILSRSVPMLTEILSCMAGLSGVRARTFFIAAILGTLPICYIYSYFGSIGEATTWQPLLIAFVIPAVGWLLVRIIKRDPVAQAEIPEVDA